MHLFDRVLATVQAEYEVGESPDGYQQGKPKGYRHKMPYRKAYAIAVCLFDLSLPLKVFWIRRYLDGQKYYS